ncbi:MAG: hydroxyethylthiazole kinase [Paracoccaceae bacterium]|jgi:hydroxyethylthiazole kinase
MRHAAPLVQCITNFVAMNFAANAVLAAGASPAMVHSHAEAEDFAAQCGALTINIGTLSPDWCVGMHAAVAGAKAHGKPWVLDPVAHFATPYRAQVARDLLSLEPDMVRGNASEIRALAGQQNAGRGVDAGDSVSQAEAAARDLAQAISGVVIVTGAVDFVTDGVRDAHVHGGVPMMTKVTAMGCALTAVTGAFAAAIDDPFDAAIAALSLFAQAGEQAATLANGPGSLAWQFLDALSAITPDAMDDTRVVMTT